MAKRGSLRDFQAHLAARLSGANQQGAAGLLGIQSGADYWLLNLSDAGEIVSLPPLAHVPLTKPWFSGMANIRGNLYAVTDFSAFQAKDPTPKNHSSQLLLIGTRHGNNAALLVTRLMGLRSLDSLMLHNENKTSEPVWVGESYSDNEGRLWKMLDVRELLTHEKFMNIGD